MYVIGTQVSLRTSLLPVVDACRAISGPTGADIRVNSLTIRTRVWEGGRPGLGAYSDTDLELPARYPIRYLTSAEINETGGQYETGDILVDHITPSDGTIGYTKDQLNPLVDSNDTEIIYVITGDHAGEYALVECRTYRPFTYQLVLRRSGRTP